MQYKTEYKALETALDYIERSSDILKSSVIPAIEKYASEAITQTTSGKYENIILQNDFSVDLGKDSTPKSLEYMSAGTKELAYIILRNALIRLYFENKTIPVIIDDALVRLDDEREKEALKLITQNKNIEQVIIFSSLKREKEILNELNIQFNKL